MSQLVDQPTAAPTRKLTADAVAQVLTAAAGIAAILGFDVGLDEQNIGSIVGGFAALVIVVGKVAGYFTRERA